MIKAVKKIRVKAKPGNGFAEVEEDVVMKKPRALGAASNQIFFVTPVRFWTTSLVSMNIILDYHSLDDGRLVELHQRGDRQAFRQIVERHQAMVCALGLSRCGDIGQSEEVAQEVFVTAWKQLPELREPQKLRAWLAGIARNLINNSVRRQQRIPTARAEMLADDLPADVDSPSDRAVSAEEAALMWSALEGIPENYREPMVLFYREQRSVPAVAATLEISEELVRQRLARGRAMLTERMAQLVEETLGRSAPPPTFVRAVLSALPLTIGSTMKIEATLGPGAEPMAKAVAAAGMVGSAAAKSGLAIKALASIAALPMLLAGVNEYLRFRARYESPMGSGHRAEILRVQLWPLLSNAAVLSAMALVIWGRSGRGAPLALVLLLGAVVFAAFAEKKQKQAMAMLTAAVPDLPAVGVRRGQAGWLWRWTMKVTGNQDSIRARDALSAIEKGAPNFEYRSAGGWLGLPWVHMCYGNGRGRGGIARGWIAVSDSVALGGLFASGRRLAVAPVSLGLAAVGLFTVGVGAIGWWALGGLVVGNRAAGGFVAAWQAAQGWVVWAHDYAIGKTAIAAHANDALAAAFVHESVFFRCAQAGWQVLLVTTFFAWVPSLLLIGWHVWRARRKA